MPRKRSGPDALSPSPLPKGGFRGVAAPAARPSPLLDTRIIYCGDCLDQLRKLPDACVDRRFVWHQSPTGDPNSNRNDEVFWGDQSEPPAAPLYAKRQGQASGFLVHFDDRHAGNQAYPSLGATRRRGLFGTEQPV